MCRLRLCLLRVERPEVLLEGDSVDDGIATHHQRVHELEYLQKESHPFLIVVSHLRQRSLRPDESAIGSQKTVVILSLLMPTPMQNTRLSKVPSRPPSSGFDGFLNEYRLLNVVVALWFFERFSSLPWVCRNHSPNASIERTGLHHWLSM